MNKSWLFYLFVISSLFTTYAQVGIGTTTPDASAELEVEATNKGILIPRVSLTDVNTTAPIASPTISLLVWNTNTSITNGQGVGFYMWNGGAWEKIITQSDASQTTLDDAYDEGGAGVGKNITADTGAVRINGVDGFLVTGTFGTGNPIDSEITGVGTRMFFNPFKGAFRAGEALGTEMNNINVGEYSASFGLGNTASGNASMSWGAHNFAYAETATAFGTQTVAAVNEATAFGYQTNATGIRSTAFGDNTEASGAGATSLGYQTIASGDYSIASGVSTSSGGLVSIALGVSTEALGDYSLAGGNSSIASGNYSLAFGNTVNTGGIHGFAVGESVTALQDYDIAFGLGSIASGSLSFAGGFNSTASGVGSFTYGISNVSSGEGSVSFGTLSEAGGDYSLVVGEQNYASGNNSFATGNGNEAPSFAEMTIGTYATTYTPTSATLVDANDRVFTIGNGISGSPSNALIVYKDGRVNINDTYTLPNTDGALDHVLKTDGSGTLTWTDSSTFGTDNQNLSYNTGTGQLTIEDGNLVTLSTGDITEVVAGDGLVGGSTAGIATINALGINGLTVTANDIRLGGTLTHATSITQGNNQMNFNLNGTGDFNIHDAGIPHFTVNDSGITSFGDDTIWRDGNSTSGGILASLYDSANSGILALYHNGSQQHNIRANSTTVFNDLGLPFDFRIESDTNMSMFYVDADTDRIGIGLNVPSSTLDINGQITIRGGSPGNGKVLTSNATGTATWQTPTISTDDQNISGSGLSGTTLTIGIEGGTNETVNLASLQDGTGTDNQTLTYSGTTLSITNGNSVTIPNGDITGVTAGAGLTGGGATGTLTINAAANNGINVDATDDMIQLGGALVENTTITQGTHDMTYNLTSTGKFNIQDAGVTHFQVSDIGNIFFGGDTYWKDNSVTGTTIAQLYDSGDDGVFKVFKDGTSQHTLNAVGTSIFNEQGGAYDFRIESDTNANMFFLDASTNRIGIGTSTPDYMFSVNGSTNLNENIASGIALRVNGDEAIWYNGDHFSWGYGGNANFFADKVGIGINAPEYKLDVRSASSSNYIAQIYNTSTTTTADGLKIRLGHASPSTTNYYVGFVDGGNGTNGRISGNGAGTGVSYYTTSDRRLKTKITDISDALGLLDKIQPRKYEYKSNLGIEEYGFIAQELQPLYPQAVSGSPDSDIKTDPMMVDYSRLTPLLAAGIKELNTTVKSQKEVIQTQKQEIENLKKRLNKIEELLNK